MLIHAAAAAAAAAAAVGIAWGSIAEAANHEEGDTPKQCDALSIAPGANSHLLHRSNFILLPAFASDCLDPFCQPCDASTGAWCRRSPGL